MSSHGWLHFCLAIQTTGRKLCFNCLGMPLWNLAYLHMCDHADKGGENILVCHFMVAYRGPGCASHIAGSSVHNQHIEKLWRDVYRCVCCSFHEVFYFLEAQGVLDSANDYDLFVLHCVFQLLTITYKYLLEHGTNILFVQRETGPLTRFG